MHALNTYKKYASNFSPKGFFFNNLHNNSIHEIFGDPLGKLPDSPPSTPTQYENCSNQKGVIERFGHELSGKNFLMKKANSVSNLDEKIFTFDDKESEDLHPRKKRNASSSSIQSVGCWTSEKVCRPDAFPIRKAESEANLTDGRTSRIFSSKWSRSLESIDVDWSGAIHKRHRSFLYILPNMNAEDTRNKNNSRHRPSSPLVPRPRHPMATAASEPKETHGSPSRERWRPPTPPPPLFSPTHHSHTPEERGTNSSLHSDVEFLRNTISHLLRNPHTPTTTEAKRPPFYNRHSLPSSQAAPLSPLHDYTFVDDASSFTAYNSVALEPSMKGSTSRSLQELASILALEEDIVELKKKVTDLLY